MKVLSELYRFHFQNERRERLFLASLSFLLTFAIVRVITYSIRSGVGPFHNVSAGGMHIHHLVWGILLLIAVGFVWLLEVGVGSTWVATLSALLFGVGLALTLDEFALWLNLKDVYWEQQGRVSVDVVLTVGGLMAIGVWGGPFVRELAKLPFKRKPGGR